MEPVGMATAELGKMASNMASQSKSKDAKSNEESGRGETWSEQDTRCLIAVWTDPMIQTQLKGFLRNNAVYDEICRRLREYGVYRTPAQCRNKTKNLRKGFRQIKLRIGPYSKSVTRQSSLFFKELDKVWGKDYTNNASELEGQEGSANSIEYKESDENAELYNGCSTDGATLSDDIEAGHYEPNDDEARSEEADKESSSNAYLYSPHQGIRYPERDRVGSVIGALQQVNQHNMERLKEAVVDLNRTFLEQQAMAEERREKFSREHEIRLFEMFLSRGGKNSHPVYPVKLAPSGKCPPSNPAWPSQGGHAPSVAPSQEQSCSSPSSSSARTPEACSSHLRCLALRLHPGDDIKECLARLVQERGIQAACIVSCVGSVRCAELRLADSKTILKLVSNHEIVSLVGTMSQSGMHLHASLADEEGKVIGGHVMGSMEVFTTAEIVIGELPNITFKREMDKDTGYRELVVESEEDMA